jgi:FeS assembly SUF system protein
MSMSEDSASILGGAGAGHTAAPGEAQASRRDDRAELKEQVIQALSSIYDPEIPVNIYELGLIYDLAVGADGDVKVTMTLTSPNCPVAASLPAEVERRIEAVPGVRGAEVDLVFDPPWSPERMSEAARLELGFF